MYLIYSILVIFAVLWAISYLNVAHNPKFAYAVYAIVGIILIGLAASRTIGIDPDSITYEKYFNSDAITNKPAVELSFILICNFCKAFSSDVHLLFFIYALLGVTLKLIAFPRLGHKEDMIMMLAIYLCYFYELHDTTQIRAGVLSGFFLLAIPYIAEKQLLYAFILILVGTFFHASGLALLPFVLLRNKPFTTTSAWIWIALIPLSYIISTMSLYFDFTPNMGYIGEKFEVYQQPDEYGDIANVHIFSPLHLLSVAIAFYLMYFHKQLTEINKYFPILLKIYIIALFVYTSFSFFPIIGERICTLYEIVWIPLIPLITYTIKPNFAGKSIALTIGFILLNYILRSMYNFVIFLEPLDTYNRML